MSSKALKLASSSKLIEEVPELPSKELLPQSDIIKLKRWNTPTIFNGWEQITKKDVAKEGFNIEETKDFMPQMGSMVGYAVTVVIHPSNESARQSNPSAWSQYRRYVAALPGPKIVVVQDLDKPYVLGSFWGEVGANTMKALGCVGTITDGAIRDVDEMTNAGFKALARRLCVGHAYVCPVKWGCEVEVFGRKVNSGQLIHADKHGFLCLPNEDVPRILHASIFMDNNECNTVIAAANRKNGQTTAELLDQLDEGGRQFAKAATKEFEESGFAKSIAYSDSK